MSGPSSRQPNARGFTIIEVVVALALVGLLAAVLIPQVTGRLVKGETATLAQNIQGLISGLQEFREDVGRYPHNLQYLVTLPSSPVDVCLGQIPAAAEAAWAGPYLSRDIPSGGLVSGSSVITTELRRTPVDLAGGVLPGTIIFSVTGVDRGVADGMEAAFDGNADFANGAIRWTAAPGVPDRGTLHYMLPIRGC